MRIHENGFSFFGGAQRGNAAAGQALRLHDLPNCIVEDAACGISHHNLNHTTFCNPRVLDDKFIYLFTISRRQQDIDKNCVSEN